MHFYLYLSFCKIFFYEQIKIEFDFNYHKNKKEAKRSLYQL